MLPIKINLSSTFFVSFVFLDVAVLDDILNRLEVGVGLGGVEDLVAVHDGYEVFCVAQINDIVCVAREHVDGLDVVAGDLELDDFVGA